MRNIFNYQAMYDQVESWSKQYAMAEPYPHMVFDGLADTETLSAGLAEFPPITDNRWFLCPEIKGDLKLKRAIWDFQKMPDTLAQILMEMNAGPFVEFLEQLTGVVPLVSDPHLYGGGLHQTSRGGRLGIHADHNINPRVSLFRRVTVILFLNDDWRNEYGGKLEMWSSDMKRCVDAVTPAFGRMAVFSNSTISFHGHPDPLTCPENITRKSIAAYFDSAEPDTSYSAERQRAVFQKRQGAM